ncbi:MAG: ABC transporter permease [Deltaproteobacteria bacterium]|nr:ABC transporter permease [Deltaproteobacteria bacterium]
MHSYLLWRLMNMVLAMFVLATLVFFLVRALPGGPFDREKTLPPEIVKNLESYYGLDQPLWKQYLDFLWGASHGDFGPSYSSPTDSVNAIMSRHLPVSAELGMWAILLALCMGIPLGVLAAYYHNSPIDMAASFVAILGRSVPPIALSPLLILVFGLYLRWVPIARWEGPAHRILPAVALGLGLAAIFARVSRSSMLQIIREDYIRTARAKGLPERSVVFIHALRNALIPVVTLLGPMLAQVLTGTFIVEFFFAVPGLGRYFITSIGNRDYPVVMGTSLLFGVALMGLNLLVDMLYSFIDPRIRVRP